MKSNSFLRLERLRAIFYISIVIISRSYGRSKTFIFFFLLFFDSLKLMSMGVLPVMTKRCSKIPSFYILVRIIVCLTVVNEICFQCKFNRLVDSYGCSCLRYIFRQMTVINKASKNMLNHTFAFREN